MLKKMIFLTLVLALLLGLGGCDWFTPVAAGSYYATDEVWHHDQWNTFSAFEVDTGQTCLILGTKKLSLSAEAGFEWVYSDKEVCLKRVK